MTSLAKALHPMLYHLNDLCCLNLTHRQIDSMVKDLTLENYSQKLIENARIQEVFIREVQVSPKDQTREVSPLLIILKSGACVIYYLEDEQPFMINGEGKKIALSDAVQADWLACYQFYPNTEINSIKDLFLVFVKRQNGQLIKLLLLSLILVILGLATPYALKILVAQVIPFHDMMLWAQLLVALLLVAILSSALTLIRRILILGLTLSGTERTEAALWQKLLRLPLSFFKPYSIMDMSVSALSFDQIRCTIDISLLGSFVSLIFSFMMIVVLFYFSVPLGAVALVVLMIIVATMLCCIKPLAQYVKQAQEYGFSLLQFNYQLIRGMEKIKLAAAQSQIFDKWMKLFYHKKTKDIKATRLFNRLIVFQRVIFSTAGIVFMVILYLSSQELSIADYIAFTTLFAFISKEIANFSMQILATCYAYPYIVKARYITSASLPPASSGVLPTEFQGGIIVEDLKLTINQTELLSHINFKINPGETLVMVGPSGSGKSTLLKCLIGLLEPDNRNSILIDNIHLEQLHLPWFRSHCGHVLQGGKLFMGSIYDNINLGRNFTLDEVRAICIELGISAWIESLPMKFHTQIMGANTLVSGGQKQLIFLARALISAPGFLFLDEATSALDRMTQFRVLKILSKAPMTKIIIAHRLDTIQWADKILVLNHGRVEALGSYQQLSTEKGLFQEMLEYQSFKHSSVPGV